MKKIPYPLFIAAATAVSAQQVNDTLVVELDEVVIRENRLHIPFDKASKSVDVISKDDIETAPARSLQEVLTLIPGVDVRQRGVSGVQADIGIRGGGFEQTLMLLNGIKLTDPQTGHHLMNIPIPLTAIQGMEVIKGPAAHIFGQNAFSGAVNVKTVLSDTFGTHAQLYGGDFGMWGAGAGVSLPTGAYKQTLAFSRDQAEGHWYNSDYTVDNLFYEGGLSAGDHHEFRVMGALADRAFGANGFYTDAFPDQWEAVRTYLTALSYTYRDDKLYVQTRGYWRQNRDEFRLRRHEPEFYTNEHVSDVWAVESNVRYESEVGISGLGIEWRNEAINSSNLGEHDRTFFGLYAEHRIEFWEGFDLRGGAYANYYEEYDWQFFPGAELGYQLSPGSRLFAGYGRSYRIPSYTELYYEDPANSSNPDLKPEESDNYELGYRFAKDKFNLSAALFHKDAKNLIEYTRPADSVAWHPDNITRIHYTGVESSVVYRTDWGPEDVKLRSVSLAYTYIDASLSPTGALESKTALSLLRQQLLAGVCGEFFSLTELGINGRYLERVSADPYFVMDARLDYNRGKKVGLFVECSNITNTDYVEAGFVQMPGRWFRAGVVFRVK